MTRRAIYWTLAAWTVGAVAATVYVLPDAVVDATRTVKAGFIAWGAGVAVFGGLLAWRDRDFLGD